MKRTLLAAFAAFAAIGAAAAGPRQGIMSDMAQNPASKISLHKAAKGTAAKQKRVVTPSPDTVWTEWDSIATAHFMLDDGLPAMLEIDYTEQNDVPVYTRSSTTQPNMVQYKFAGVYGGVDLTVNVDAATGAASVLPQPTGLDAWGMPLDVIDFGALFALHGEDWLGLSPEETQELVDEYDSFNYYIPELGRFYIYLGYLTEGIDDALAMTDCQIQLKGAQDYSVKVSTETFISDAADLKGTLSFPEGTECLYGVFSGMHCQAFINEVLENGEGIVSTTTPGTIALNADEGPGLYTVVAITLSSIGEPMEWGYSEYTFTPSGSEGWTAAGEGEYTSDIFESLLGLTPPTYKVEVERNEANPAIYRIVNPYGAGYPYFQLADATAPAGTDLYIVFDATDPEKVYFEPTNIGLDFGAGWWMGMCAGYYLEIYDSRHKEDLTRYGKLADGVITFAEGAVFVTADHLDALGGQNNALYTGALQLVLPTSGAEMTTADSEEVEYFNLQGIPVANPAQGEPVIVRKAGSFTKAIK